MARSATIRATTTMPAMPAVVHARRQGQHQHAARHPGKVGGEDQAGQALRQRRARGDPSTERTEGDHAQAQQLEDKGKIQASHFDGTVRGSPGKRPGEDREPRTRDDGEDGVAPQGAPQQAVG